MKLFRKWLEVLYKSTLRQQEFLPAAFTHLGLHTEIASSSWNALRALIRLNGLSDDGSVSYPGSPHQAWPRPVVWSPGACLLLCTLCPTWLWSLGLLCSLAPALLDPSWHQSPLPCCLGPALLALLPLRNLLCLSWPLLTILIVLLPKIPIQSQVTFRSSSSQGLLFCYKRKLS